MLKPKFAKRLKMDKIMKNTENLSKSVDVTGLGCSPMADASKRPISILYERIAELEEEVKKLREHLRKANDPTQEPYWPEFEE
jgi:hypothetical protein